MNEVRPEAPSEMLDMLVIQKQGLQRNPLADGGEKQISLCLSLWCRNSRNYQQLRGSKVLILPHSSTLKLYKTVLTIKQDFIKAFLWLQGKRKSIFLLMVVLVTFALIK